MEFLSLEPLIIYLALYLNTATINTELEKGDTGYWIFRQYLGYSRYSKSLPSRLAISPGIPSSNILSLWSNAWGIGGYL